MTTAQVRNLVAGEWVGDPLTGRRNPAHPAEVVAVVASSGAETVTQAIDAAVDAQPGWAATPAAARGAVLMEAERLLASAGRSSW